MIKILDKGFVVLESWMGDDLGVVNAARVSLNARSNWECENLLSAKDAGLINFLMRERHGTPFEHNAFTFHVKCPIFVAREWQRHRIGSFNEMSGRYTKLEAEFYIPDYVRTQTGKPGAYTFEEVGAGTKTFTQVSLEATYDEAWRTYEHLLEAGVAKELARLALPVSIYTQFFWTVNARSLMNFLSLRMAETAMFEIRCYAEAVCELWSEVMPETYGAWCSNDWVAP